MYHIIICDDEPEISLNIKTKLQTELNKKKIPADYFIFNDSRNLIDALGTMSIDILFLDLDMPYFTGMDIARALISNNRTPILIFVTSHDTLVYQTFEYKPFAFIRKSHFDHEIIDVVNRIDQELNEKKQELILTKGSEISKLKINNIIYIESKGNYITLVTINDTIKHRDTMSNIENELNIKGFIRCHKGYLINPDYIVKYKVNEIELQCNDNTTILIPVGRSYEKDVRRKILESMR